MYTKVDRKGRQRTQYPGRAKRVIREDWSRHAIRLSPAPTRLKTLSLTYVSASEKDGAIEHGLVTASASFVVPLRTEAEPRTERAEFLHPLLGNFVVSRFASVSCGKAKRNFSVKLSLATAAAVA